MAYNTRAYPANQQILLDLLATRQEIASLLDFRSWADLATADQMMGSATNARAFLSKLDEASREGARREHQADTETSPAPASPILPRSTLSAAPTGTNNSAAPPSISIPNPSAPISPISRSKRASLTTAARLFKVDSAAQLLPAGIPASPSSMSTTRGRSRRPFLPRHAPARRQRQVVLRRGSGARRARPLPARGRAYLQLSRRRLRSSYPITEQQPEVTSGEPPAIPATAG